jgi:hypothetical protein
VQHRDQHDGDGPGEVKRLSRLRQHPVRVAQVGIDVGGRAVAAAREQRASVRQHDRIIVDVDHPAVWCLRLGDLVGVAGARDAGADVEELADASVVDQVRDGAGEERAVGAH